MPWRATPAIFPAASLENLLNEAAILAASRDAEKIEPADIHAAFIKTVAARIAKARLARGKAHRRRARGGHALASHLRTPEHHIRRVSILPSSGGAAGYNLSIPPERTMLKKQHIEAQIEVLLAGRAAELLAGGEEALTAARPTTFPAPQSCARRWCWIWAWATNRLLRSGRLARACGATQDALPACRAKLNELYKRVFDLLLENADALLRLTNALCEREALTGEEVEALLAA